MRSLATLVLCLGLFAAVQALDLPMFHGVPLDITAFAPENSTIAGEGGPHHHSYYRKRYWGPRHDPDDHHYWGERHHYANQFLQCLKSAAGIYQPGSPQSLPAAIERLAWCIKEHFDRCHDHPSVPIEFPSTVPLVLFIKGIKAIIANGPGGLTHAGAILSFYIAGGVPGFGGASPIWYTGPPLNPNTPQCAFKLVTTLGAALANIDSVADIVALASALVEFLVNTVLTAGATLGACAPDVPAVLLSLISTYCPTSNTIYNPLAPLVVSDGSAPLLWTPITCPGTGPQYENGPGALLAGAVITTLLLSNNPALRNTGIQLGFTMNRFALAATQTTSFKTCVGTNITNFPTYTGELPKYTGDVTANFGVPKKSGPLGGAGPQAEATLPITPDGIRTLCAAIASVSGPSPNPWLSNLLWQGTANVALAVRKTIDQSPPDSAQPGNFISCSQAKSLCVYFDAIYAFTTTVPPTSNVVVTAPGPTGSNGRVNFTCMTTAAGCITEIPSDLNQAANGNWQFLSSPKLDAPFDDEPTWCSCT